MDYEKIKKSAALKQKIFSGVIYFFLAIWGLFVLFPFLDHASPDLVGRLIF